MQTVTELGEARKEIKTLLAQLKEAAAMQADSLALNETEFRRVLALDSAHYNLSTQSFTAVWAVLDFLQRFMVDPILANDPQHQENLRLSLSGTVRRACRRAENGRPYGRTIPVTSTDSNGPHQPTRRRVEKGPYQTVPGARTRQTHPHG